MDRKFTSEVEEGKLFVSVTEVKRGRLYHDFISSFKTVEDVHMALLASSAIPFYCTKSNLPALKCKDRWLIW